MGYLQTKLRRIDEANHINRLMNGTPTIRDVPGYVHFDTSPPKRPDDIIKVWVANPNKPGWLQMVEMPRFQHEAEVKAMNDAFDAKQREKAK